MIRQCDEQSEEAISMLGMKDCFGQKIPALAMTQNIKTKTLISHRDESKLTRYHSDSCLHPRKGSPNRRSLDDYHHPVLITENSSGLLTLFSACGSEMIFDLHS
jgi:hypothetical protein